VLAPRGQARSRCTRQLAASVARRPSHLWPYLGCRPRRPGGGLGFQSGRGARQLSPRSSSSIDAQRSTHSSQIALVGPAMIFWTSRAGLPQNAQLASSLLSSRGSSSLSSCLATCRAALPSSSNAEARVSRSVSGSSSVAVSWSKARSSSCQAMTGSRGLSRRSSQGGRQSGLTRWGCGDESCGLGVAEGCGFRFSGFGDACQPGGEALAGVERSLEPGVGGGVVLGGEPPAAGVLVVFVVFVVFVGLAAGRKEHQGGNAADEH
jgi:hypothetical protein